SSLYRELSGEMLATLGRSAGRAHRTQFKFTTWSSGESGAGEEGQWATKDDRRRTQCYPREERLIQ
ncbi:15731_t:CDS:1, partial [Acaulospora morrowiae]